ncbi:aldehyde dehydrogenase (NADP(+)) [Planctomonas psychrotolerans]|uniref:aldehyde dehydrogenase (NADP(+)) n=1 Tax=Planctomonas psychrotolerans TaxID=2528712 RepID=UPI00123A603D|nr:aldehyde dehydrogenase (NADP(+)) [Planctomonas psychrotolerans]
MTTTLPTTDPRSGTTRDTGIEPTSEAQVGELTAAAAEAFSALRAHPRSWRAGLLRALADGLEARRADLLSTAEAETGLVASPRLDGELTRSAYQLRLFAEAVEEGGYLEATIDSAGDTPMGPGPDVRRMLIPIGPVAVFGSSNFPFAFSVAGGDTASALAAGNPVIVKAHGSHPLTSRASFEALRDAADAYGAPSGTIGIVYSQSAGATLVADPRVAAVGFTGSLSTGRILLDIIEKRDRPIPFYGELSSLNPLIVTPGAAAARGAEIAEGLYASFTASTGQLCTKPGIAFLPRGAAADEVVSALVERAREAGAQPLLNSRIHEAFDDIAGRLVSDGHARSLVASRAGEDGFTVTPGVLEIDARDMTAAVTEEAFGPLIVLARYSDLDEVRTGLTAVPDSLTATLHAEDSELDDIAPLATELQDLVGRLVFNGYPTGVRVSWGQHHGGPWPATNSAHTSVGITAIRRFLRPIAWQSAPEALLPKELRDGFDAIPRRVDGVLRLAGSTR